MNGTSELAEQTTETNYESPKRINQKILGISLTSFFSNIYAFPGFLCIITVSTQVSGLKPNLTKAASAFIKSCVIRRLNDPEKAAGIFITHIEIKRFFYPKLQPDL